MSEKKDHQLLNYYPPPGILDKTTVVSFKVITKNIYPDPAVGTSIIVPTLSKRTANRGRADGVTPY